MERRLSASAPDPPTSASTAAIYRNLVETNGTNIGIIGTRTFPIMGIGLLGATAVAKVRNINDGPDEFFRVQPGEVLVCRSTAPSWTGLFATVGAVVTDSGGILSHASTVAREYGIPCVVGTREATRVFSDGDLVMVDGSQGRAVIDG